MFKIAKLHPDAQIPKRADKGSAGLDICTVQDVTVQPGDIAIAPTGLAIEINREVYARIAPRSGLAVKNKIHVMAGVVDSSYRGEIKVVLSNLGKEPVTFSKGDRVAQIILEKISMVEPREVDLEDLKVSERGTAGFGSTGSN